MQTKTKTSYILAAVILVCLALLSLAAPFARFQRVFPTNGINRQAFSGQNRPSNGSNFTGSTPFRTGRAARPLGGLISRIGSIAFTLVGLVASGVAAYGLWSAKRWGVILATILAALYLLASLPSLLVSLNGFGSILSRILPYFQILLALIVAALAWIPSLRRAES